MDLLPDILAHGEPITTLTDIDPKTFKKEFFNKKKPVLLKGFAKKWPAFHKWNFDFFANLQIEDQIDMEVGNVLNKDTVLTERKIKDFLEDVRDNKDKGTDDKTYLTAYQIFEEFPELLNDVDFSYLTDNTVDDVPAVWIGPKGTITGLHSDDHNNMLAQIVGRKIMIVASPKFKQNFYPSPKFDYGAVLSRVDLNNFDEEKFPAFREIEFFIVELEPGDVLYNPKGWWHYVKSLEPSISTNTFAYTRGDMVFLRPVEWLKITLHHRGLYKANNCTCHAVVNGVRVAK
ncbi:cupin-like domain-containing protein [Allomuricauda sp. SCSIO 65647]|uniref:cupin-like domain-containing protein n=1 Tax=Allomuricauda sp. SCSIO 65647 TaxID=2908843 RepID=UPI001F2B88A1|nr:cupin-like domain-containing protein [Muricauda sp. SCSIO 65647]UJH66687.1 cupin-like domain-containing protein [Muricauda sp. SCSIO 65647]